MFINARIDTHWLAGSALDRGPDTLMRLKIYRDAGASGGFVPGLTDSPLTERIAVTIQLPLNVLA